MSDTIGSIVLSLAKNREAHDAYKMEELEQREENIRSNMESLQALTFRMQNELSKARKAKSDKVSLSNFKGEITCFIKEIWPDILKLSHAKFGSDNPFAEVVKETEGGLELQEKVDLDRVELIIEHLHTLKGHQGNELGKIARDLRMSSDESLHVFETLIEMFKMYKAFIRTMLNNEKTHNA
ncbi:MAG: hypothetical protein A3F09_02725 [Chlamydiae bacterium RIFCSPHIGHO2_12_FULL_49_11]|nr:MAG: hypothetical protein A3F09_02725 [Chlamydiae bacterium RIFCSPHIGHO2_12_FULL_49_11]